MKKGKKDYYTQPFMPMGKRMILESKEWVRVRDTVAAMVAASGRTSPDMGQADIRLIDVLV